MSPSGPVDEPGAQTAVTKRPLCVDLDGTLVATDTLWESFMALLKRAPQRLVPLLFSIFGGRARIKRHLSELAPVDPSALPYRDEVVELARRARRDGREVVLITASDQSTAAAVAAHVNLFDEAVGSDGTRNLKGPRKAA